MAFLLVLAIVPDRPSWQIAAFFLFRAFDVVKPPPIRDFEQRFKGGFGVMFEDLLAAGCSRSRNACSTDAGRRAISPSSTSFQAAFD